MTEDPLAREIRARLDALTGDLLDPDAAHDAVHTLLNAIHQWETHIAHAWVLIHAIQPRHAPIATAEDEHDINGGLIKRGDPIRVTTTLPGGGSITLTGNAFRVRELARVSQPERPHTIEVDLFNGKLVTGDGPPDVAAQADAPDVGSPSRQRKDLPIETIVAEYRAGDSTLVLGERYRVHHSTIHRRLQEVGEIRTLDEANEARAGRPFLRAGSVTDLAADIGLAPDAVEELLVQHGFLVVPPTRTKRKGSREGGPSS